MPRKIRILVADDHTIVRMGIVALLNTEPDIEVIAEADDGLAAVRAVEKNTPDIVIMDLLMPIMDGETAIGKIHAAHPDVKILILTTSTSSDEIIRAIKQGADGAIAKNSPYNELVAAIHDIAQGRRSISPEIERIINCDPPITRLSPRQQEIMQFIAKGMTNPDIAKLLGISLAMVKEHVNLILSKLGAANRSEAISIALRKHLLKI